jgi:hypothetical protein
VFDTLVQCASVDGKVIGVDFCRMNNIIITFPEQCFTMERDGIVS